MTDQAPSGLLDRTLERIGRAFRGVAEQARVAWTGSYRPDLPDDDLTRLRRQVDLCLETRGGAVSARARAADLGRAYLALNAMGRLRFLQMLAQDYGIDRVRLGEAVTRWQAASDDAARDGAEADMRLLLVSPSIRLLSQFNGLPEGVKFLVDLRADLLRLSDKDPGLARLAEDLRGLLAHWFDIGFLTLERIGWDAPAALLEKLIDYEAVHEIRSWRDLKNRLGSDRRCFAFFHPQMPGEPLIFVEVALVDGITVSVQALLDEGQPALDPEKSDTAIFYSISNCQRGLAGVSFGDFLIKRVVDLLTHELPNVKTFATLSPMPRFLHWLEEEASRGGEMLMTEEEHAALAPFAEGGEADLVALARRPGWHRDVALAAALQAPLMRQAARYLLEARDGRRAYDRVAHFHLTNGARIERLNWLADISENGLRQSAGMMVNYRYKLDEIEANHEKYRGDGEIAALGAVRKFLKT
ncbi:MAG TPA: malonyl-CoA decarboxylase [Candidatus Cybelea sp.]|nr:malonyl-CoA decarboxylase [Candidatus Cybelea sp.]